jgi:hypothetical protein
MHLNKENLCIRPEKYSWKAVIKSEYNREVPSARWGHSMILVNDHILIFGGYAGNT